MIPEWGQITAAECVGPAGARAAAGSAETKLAGIATDSRRLRPGELFWAIKGEHFDGHDFAGQALSRGGAGAMLEVGYWDRIGAKGREELSRYGKPVFVVDDTLYALGELARWWRRQHPVKVAAITGSAGKTTTKEMTAAVLGRAAATLRNPGNFNNLIGLPLSLLELTPVHFYAVVELGMNRPGEIARLTAIAAPDAGAITNIGLAHTEGVGDVEGVVAAKWELVECMPESSPVVLNGDDERLLARAADMERPRILFGTRRHCQIRACRIEERGAAGCTFELHYEDEAWRIRLRVPGRHNVMNALAAAALGLTLGVTEEQVVHGLESFEGLAGRFRVIPLPGGMTLVDDTYNANPSSLGAAAAALPGLLPDRGRLIVALGEMLELGRAASGAHHEAGTTLAALSPAALLVVGEHAGEVIQGAVDAGYPSERAIRASDRDDLLMRLTGLMRPGDVVFLKGSRRMGLEKVAEGLKEAWRRKAVGAGRLQEQG